MAALHQSGGVPPGWTFSPPPGDPISGHRLFRDFGCPTCHNVQGAGFPTPGPSETAIGPDLTGMGSHHPPEYFAESIMNPDAVLVEGPGYIGEDGRSIMPTYPDMTVQQLADLVAYLGTLTSGGNGDHAGHHHGPQRAAVGDPLPDDNRPLPPMPVPPPQPAGHFLVRIYNVKQGQLGAFTEWFARKGRRELLAYPGMRSIDTYVDRTCAGPVLVTIFGFRDERAIDRFLGNPDAAPIHTELARFIVQQDDYTFSSPPLYKVEALSGPPATETDRTDAAKQ